ncbi:HNH endonuclease signature motif containing protein [Georgenia alba]|uniref:DUF222 domain-containing protein n=1 Tax=Georgenia alba TaxID=2233858 RepID=A0ABW2Q9E8_9MICO
MFDTEGRGSDGGHARRARPAGEQAGSFGLVDATARHLESLPGGPELANQLFAVELSEVSDQALIEVVAGFERVASAAQAGQGRAISELLARRGSSSWAFDDVVDELRARLAITGRAAEAKVGLAAACESYPEVADALAVGRIDVRKATVLSQRQPGVSEAQHRDLTRELLAIPTSTGVPGGDDGDAAAADAGDAVTDGQPDTAGADDDPAAGADAGEAGPAAGAVGVGEVERTAPQLKADVRRHALQVDPEAGALRREAEYGERHVRFEPLADAMARVTAYLRADDARTVASCLDVLVDGTRTPTDRRTIDQRRADAFVDLFATTLDGSRTTAAAAAAPARTTGTHRPRDGAEVPGSTGGAAGGDTHAAGGGAHGAGSTRRRARAQVHVTVAAGTLLGLDDEPAEMAGYGPIPAELARRIAQDATWRGLFTDARGEFVALGTKAYRPGAVLSRAVRARDVRCTFPGCRQPAVYCDLDHLDAYDPALADRAQQTTESNLHPLCRRHHNLKTNGTWAVRRQDGGGRVWIAPTNHTYTRRPEPPTGAPRRRSGGSISRGSAPPSSPNRRAKRGSGDPGPRPSPTAGDDDQPS